MKRRIRVIPGIIVAAGLLSGALVAAPFVAPGLAEGVGAGGTWMADFRDATYYAVRALLDGRNPYDPSVYFAHYPVGQEFPAYSPHHLLLFLPLGLLSYGSAAGVFFVASVVCTVLLVRTALRWAGWTTSPAVVLGLTGIVLVSRPGHVNLVAGQITALVVLGCWLALSRRSGDALAGVLLVVIRAAEGPSAFVTSVFDGLDYSVTEAAADRLSPFIVIVDLASAVRFVLDRDVGTALDVAAAVAVVAVGSILLRRTRSEVTYSVISTCVLLLAARHIVYDVLVLRWPLAMVLGPAGGGLPVRRRRNPRRSPPPAVRELLQQRCRVAALSTTHCRRSTPRGHVQKAPSGTSIVGHSSSGSGPSRRRRRPKHRGSGGNCRAGQRRFFAA